AEVVEYRSALSAYYPVVDVHEDVGAGLQLGHARQVGVDVISAGAAARQDFRREPALFHTVEQFQRRLHRIERMSAALGIADNVRRHAGIGGDSAQLQPGGVEQFFRQGEPLFVRADACPVQSQAKIDKDIQVDSRRDRRPAELVGVYWIVDDGHQ